MRWKIHTPPKVGDKDKRLKFAWKPITIDGYRVWLEFYGIEREWLQMHVDIVDGVAVRRQEQWSEGRNYLVYWQC